MMQCDICGKKVSRLERGLPELEALDVCEECRQDLSRRQSAVEKRLVELRQKMRAEAITDWRRERAAKGTTGSS
jgi:ribosome-binding protein aMBF1 (putative translation factor)